MQRSCAASNDTALDPRPHETTLRVAVARYSLGTGYRQVVAAGQHSLNISHASVDAVLAGPSKTWKPLRLRVVEGLLTSDERLGRVELSADVIGPHRGRGNES